MTIQAGLFQLNMSDHHAVLGFSLAADPKKLRKRYLKIARQLHPDSLRDVSEAQRQLASQLLSKRVNPAYETLSQDKLAKEHEILLTMKQQQLVASPELVPLKSDRAKQLLASRKLEADYAAAIEEIASTQFSDLSQVESIIGELSEINAAYLIKTKQSSASTGLALLRQKRLPQQQSPLRMQLVLQECGRLMPLLSTATFAVPKNLNRSGTTLAVF